MIKRHYQNNLLEQLDNAPAVVIWGARQVGKITLAIQAAKKLKKDYIYLDLENTNDLEKLSPNAEIYINYHKDKLIILDEIQAYPTLMNSLRGIIDRDHRNTRFIILGSASPHLVKGISESLAGRIAYLDLPPFRLDEVYPKFSKNIHWLRGGFPLSFLADSDKISMEWRSNFIRSYVERDLNLLFGHTFNPILSLRLWSMLAFHHGNMLNAQDLSRSLGVTSPVIVRYIEFIEGAYLLIRLQPWFTNTTKRLVKSPKIYLKDSGILHYFMNITNTDQLINHPIVGASWEGYVIEQISYHKPKSIDLYFYRTHVGAEIDLLFVKNNKPIAALEIKYSNSPKVSKGFYIACNDLEITKKYVITPSSDTYPINHETMVMNLWDFIQSAL